MKHFNTMCASQQNLMEKQVLLEKSEVRLQAWLLEENDIVVFIF